VLGGDHDDVLALFTNHPKLGDVGSFNQALCGLYAWGLGLLPSPRPMAVTVSSGAADTSRPQHSKTEREAPGEPAWGGAAWGEPAMVERAMGATRHLSGTRLIRRCVYTVSPHLARVRAHSACGAAPAPTQLPSGLLRPPLSVSLQRMRVNAETTPRSGNPAFSDDLWPPQAAGAGGSGGIAAGVFGAQERRHIQLGAGHLLEQ